MKGPEKDAEPPQKSYTVRKQNVAQRPSQSTDQNSTALNFGKQEGILQEYTIPP